MDKTIARKEVPYNSIDSKIQDLRYIFALYLQIYGNSICLEYWSDCDSSFILLIQFCYLGLRIFRASCLKVIIRFIANRRKLFHHLWVQVRGDVADEIYEHFSFNLSYSLQISWQASIISICCSKKYLHRYW